MRGALVGLLLLAAPIAHAQPEKGLGDPADKDRASADDLFDKGRVYYEANKFQAAIELFTQAYSLVHDPVYLFNIAQSYRNSADCLNAFEYYNRYLTESPSAENADAVRTWLREMQPCAEQRKKEQDLAKRAVELEREKLVVAVRPAEGPRDVIEDRGASLRIAGLATGGAGMIGLVVGIVYGVKSQSYENEIAAACMTECNWNELKGRDDAGRTANTISTIGYIAGGLGLAAGAGLYIYGRMQVERVVVTPTATGATVSAQLRF